MNRIITFSKEDREEEIQTINLLLWKYRPIMSKLFDTISFSRTKTSPKLHINIKDMKLTINKGEDNRNKSKEEVIEILFQDLEHELANYTQKIINYNYLYRKEKENEKKRKICI